jgi:hypothetical protein
MAEFPGGGILGPIGNVVSAIGSLIGSFIGITAARLLEFLKLLKDYVLKLSHELLIGVFRTARAIARLLRTVATLAAHGVKAFATWAYREIVKLHDFLAAKFGPVLKWLKELKQHIRDIYDRFVRPIIDVIQFIRQLNALLELFHISLLKKLDATLAQIEQRIEAPFLWVTQKITWLENWIDRIVTLDGIFQRVTLLKSMAKYVAPWSHGFWNSQIDPTRTAGDAYSRGRIYPHDEVWAPGKELALFYRRQGSRIDASVAELVPAWRQAAGVDPPGPDEG